MTDSILITYLLNKGFSEIGGDYELETDKHLFIVWKCDDTIATEINEDLIDGFVKAGQWYVTVTGFMSSYYYEVNSIEELEGYLTQEHEVGSY